MRRFTRLHIELDRTTRTSEKLAALRAYFAQAAPEDAAWALYFLTGRRFRRAVQAAQLRQWAAEVSGYPAWLVDESYDTVGDLAETIALLLPEQGNPTELPLHRLAQERIAPLVGLPDRQRRALVLETWQMLDAPQRLVWHKLLLGNFRVGVARRLVTRALAELAAVDPAVMAHRLMGQFQPTVESYRAILTGDRRGSDHARPYPFFLASPLEWHVEALGLIEEWQVEWKWDGVRAQLLQRGGQTVLWSRGEEFIHPEFPEIVASASSIPAGTVLDGEVVAWEGDRPLPFSALQRRLGRKEAQPALFTDVPVRYLAFDLLEENGRDIREESLRDRRSRLEQLVASIDGGIVLSPVQAASNWAEARVLHGKARQVDTEGLIIKRLDSPYRAGRTRGDWWKWKVDPFSVDAVLMNAQRGHGRRAGLFTDYTFGLWDDGALVPVAKAYSGLTDEEMREVDRHVRATTITRQGPVHIVRPELVFELGFEGIQESTRHKSGVAVRFPRMLRWRKDKKPKDADSLEAMRRLLRREG